MNRTVLLVPVILLSWGTGGYGEDSDWVKDKLKGRVHQYNLVETEYNVKIIPEDRREAEPIEKTRKIKIYNEKGLLAEESRAAWQEDDWRETSAYRYVYRYASGDTVLEMEIWRANGQLFSICKNKIDLKGNVIQRTYTSDDAGELSVFQYKYNGKGQVLEVSGRDYANKTTSVDTYAYDGQFNLIGIRQLRDGVLFNRVEMNYDAAGNMIEFVSHSPGKYQKISSQYNARNQLIAWIEYRKPDHQASSRYECTYDHRGNLVQLRMVEPESSTWKREPAEQTDFRYDDRGNVVHEETVKFLYNGAAKEFDRVVVNSRVWEYSYFD